MDMMKPDAMSAIRANIVLFGLSVVVIASLCMMYAVVAGEGDLIGLRSVRVSILVAAAVLSVFVRLKARLAYEQAIKQAYVEWRLEANDSSSATIDHRAQHGWLIQLHIETHPACARRTAAFAP